MPDALPFRFSAATAADKEKSSEGPATRHPDHRAFSRSIICRIRSNSRAGKNNSFVACFLPFLLPFGTGKFPIVSVQYRRGENSWPSKQTNIRQEGFARSAGKNSPHTMSRGSAFFIQWQTGGKICCPKNTITPSNMSTTKTAHSRSASATEERGACPQTG